MRGWVAALLGILVVLAITLALSPSPEVPTETAVWKQGKRVCVAEAVPDDAQDLVIVPPERDRR